MTIPGAERNHTLTLQTLNAQAFVVFVDEVLVSSQATCREIVMI